PYGCEPYALPAELYPHALPPISRAVNITQASLAARRLYSLLTIRPFPARCGYTLAMPTLDHPLRILTAMQMTLRPSLRCALCVLLLALTETSCGGKRSGAATPSPVPPTAQAGQPPGGE